MNEFSQHTSPFATSRTLISSLRRGLPRILLTACVTLTGCASGPAPATTSPTGPAPASSAASARTADEQPSPCEAAALERAEVPALLAASKLDRAARGIGAADARCPETAPRTWGALVKTLAELGRTAEALALASVIEARPDAPVEARAAAAQARASIAAIDAPSASSTAKDDAHRAFEAASLAQSRGAYADAKRGFLEAWGLAHPHGVALFSAGLAAKSLGDAAGAQRLFDRALVDLERTTGQKVTPVVPPPPEGGALAWGRGTQLLAVVRGAAISVRDASVGHRETLRLEGHADTIAEVAFSPDGRTLASGSEDGTVRLWSVDPLGSPTYAESATSAPRTLDAHAGRVVSVVFSRDGATVFAGGADGTVRAWDLATGTVARRIVMAPSAPNTGARLELSPDGRTLALATELTGSGVKLVHLVDLVKTASLAEATTPAGYEANAFAFSADGKSLLIKTDTGLHRVVVATGRDVGRVVLSAAAKRAGAEPQPWVPGYAQAADGKVGASTDSDGTVHVFDTRRESDEDRVVLREERLAIGATSALAPDGATLAAGFEDGTLRLLDLRGGAAPRKLATRTRWLLALSFSPDGKTLLSGAAGGESANSSGDVRLWDVARGTSARELQRGDVGEVVFSPDGDTVAWSGSYTASAATGKVTKPFAHGGAAALAFSPDGKLLATGGQQGVRLWDMATKNEQRAFGDVTTSVTALSFSPDGKILAAGSKGAVRVWDVATGAERANVQAALGAVRCLAFSPDGGTLVIGTASGVLHFVEVATGHELRRVDDHEGSINSVAFSRDGARLVSSSQGGAVRIRGPEGESRLVIRAVATRNAAYLSTAGEAPLVELVGPDANVQPSCRLGRLSFPFDLCRERFEAKGLLSRASSPAPRLAR